MPMATDFSRLGIWNEELASIKSHGLSIQRKNLICYTSTTKRPMATKPGKKVTCCEKLPTIKSHNPLNIWSREVT